MRMLESDRLILRPVERNDLPFLLDLRWDSDIMNYMIHEPISLESQQAWLENTVKSKDIVLSIFVKEANASREPTLAGITGLADFSYRHQRATWRPCMVASAFQRRGIAFEVGSMCLDYGFNTLNLNRMVGNCLPGNAAIVRLMKKLGFVEEGVMRQHFFHQGCFKDAISWGILREDFNGKRKGDLSLNAGSRGPETTL